MTEPHTVLEMTRIDAQNLHKKISANMAKAEKATWADVKASQADIKALVVKMKALAADQADSVKSSIKTATAKLEAAGKLLESKGSDAKDNAKDDVKHANEAMLDGANKAAQSISAAVAAARTKLAHAIEPKKVVS